MLKKDSGTEAGIAVDDVTFDADGTAQGLSDDILDAVAGGIAQETTDPNLLCFPNMQC